MPIPKTFSAPSDTTFANLNGYAPSAEDCLRYAVWLMLYSDDVNRAYYSFDDNDPAKGVRIRQNIADEDPATGNVILPQQLVAVFSSETKWKDHTGNSGEKKIAILIVDLAKPDSTYIDEDVAVPEITPEARYARLAEILRRGTIIGEDDLGNPDRQHVVVDPYYSPRLPDGTYDLTQIKYLATMPPAIGPMRRQKWPNKRVTSEADFWKLDPVKDFAVAYGVLATYHVDFSDREDMRHGG